jgi:hypothetical protein
MEFSDQAHLPTHARYFHAVLPWPILLLNLSPGTSVDDLRTALTSYGDIVHCFLLTSPDNVLGAIIHFTDRNTAAAAAADLDGTCADSFDLTARLMDQKEQAALTLLRRIT